MNTLPFKLRIKGSLYMEVYDSGILPGTLTIAIASISKRGERTSVSVSDFQPTDISVMGAYAHFGKTMVCLDERGAKQVAEHFEVQWEEL